MLITQGLTNTARIEGFLITGGFANGVVILFLIAVRLFSIMLVAECIILLLLQALSIPCLAEIQLLYGGGMYNSSSSPKHCQYGI